MHKRNYNFDSRGVKRGKCACDSCDIYEMLDEKFPTCGYCGCPPAKHLVIESLDIGLHQNPLDINNEVRNISTPQELSSILSSKASNLILTKTSQACETLKPPAVLLREKSSTISISKNSESSKKSSTMTSKLNLSKPSTSASTSLETVSTLSSENLPSKVIEEICSFEKYVPKLFEPSVMKALKEGNLLSKHKCSMIRDIGRPMLKNGETSSKFRTSVALLVKLKFPELGTCSAIEKRLHFFFKNQNKKLNSQHHSPESESSISSSKPVNDLEKMEIEMGMKRVNKTLLKDLLNNTRNMRIEDAAKLNAYDLLQKYRALLDEDLFLWEFTQVVNIGVQKLRQNWNESIQKLCKILPTPPGPEDNIVIHLLLNIPLLFKSNQNREQKGLLLLYPDKVTLSKSIPDKSKAPFLTGIGDKPRNLMCYVDSHSLFVTKPEEAVILLMSAYWIFGITFEKELRHQLVLIAICIFGSDSKDILSKKDSNLLKVLDVVEKAKLSI